MLQNYEKIIVIRFIVCGLQSLAIELSISINYNALVIFIFLPYTEYVKRESTHIAQNMARRCQEYFVYSIAIEILSQNFCQMLQNFSSHYNFNFLKYF